MHPRVALAAALLLTLAGCGSEDGSPGVSARDSRSPAAYPSFLQTEGGSLLVTCGDLTGFPATAMAEGLPDALTQDEAVAIFTDLVSDPANGETGTFFPSGPDRSDWRVLRDQGDAYTIGLGPWSADGPGDGALVIYVQQHEAGWLLGGGGACRLAPMLASGHA